MPITLGTNIPSYSSRMQLNKVSDGLNGIYQKLSTGSKINKAGDDAAGLVISQNMQAKINGSKQAMKNIQTAESFLKVAEDGMVSISDHFQRINDLLTDMANDTNGIESRTAAIREVIERLSEIDRLAKSTNFNGMSMLDGSVESILVQMGPDSDADTSVLDISTALSDCHVKSFNAELPGALHPDAKINSEDDKVLIPKTYKDEYWLLKRTSGSADPTYKILTKNENGDYVDASDGSAYEEAEGDTITEVKEGYEIENTSGDNTIVLSDGAETPTYYTVGTNAQYTVGDLTDAFQPSNETCRNYMETIQNAISKIATQRGLLGAYENRMESSYDSLSTRIESLESAKVPYTDTDIAEEATALTRSQIMQQINVAVLSNTNTTQQLALSLLG